jgi:hypothetical protein
MTRCWPSRTSNPQQLIPVRPVGRLQFWLMGNCVIAHTRPRTAVWPLSRDSTVKTATYNECTRRSVGTTNNGFTVLPAITTLDVAAALRKSSLQEEL